MQRSGGGDVSSDGESAPAARLSVAMLPIQLLLIDERETRV